MPITIEEVLNRGFAAWTRNLKISIPFILAAIIVGIMWIAYVVLFIAAVVPSVSPLMAEPVMSDIIEAITPYITLFAGGLVVLPAVFTLWWTYLYMGKTGWDVQDPKKLDTPKTSELESLE